MAVTRLLLLAGILLGLIVYAGHYLNTQYALEDRV